MRHLRARIRKCRICGRVLTVHAQEGSPRQGKPHCDSAGCNWCWPCYVRGCPEQLDDLDQMT